MVSLDDAVLARLEKGGKRYEILVDPELVEKWKENASLVSMQDLLATEEVWSDARAASRLTNVPANKMKTPPAPPMKMDSHLFLHRT